MKEKILVTGGAGYIGSILVHDLLNQEYEVTVLDNFYYKQSSLLNCANQKNITIINDDVRNYDLVKNLITKNDIIIPLAGLVGAPICKKFPVDSQEINYDAQLNIFKNKSKKVIMVHAGIPPNLSLENCFDLNKEFQVALKKNPKRILKKVFNNPFSKFSKKMSKIDRIIFFANALTRIRACNDKGKVDFNFKGRINEIPKKLNAWFNFENSIISGNSQLIFGHWAAIKGETKKKDIIGLDTGCVWGDKLTIMRLEDNKRFQINRIKKWNII